MGVHGHRCGHHAAHAAGGGTRLAIVSLVRVDATHHSSAVRRRVASVYPLLFLTTAGSSIFSRLCVSFHEQEFVKSTSLEVQNVRDIVGRVGICTPTSIIEQKRYHNAVGLLVCLYAASFSYRRQTS